MTPAPLLTQPVAGLDVRNPDDTGVRLTLQGPDVPESQP